MFGIVLPTLKFIEPFCHATGKAQLWYMYMSSLDSAENFWWVYSIRLLDSQNKFSFIIVVSLFLLIL